MSEKFQTPLMSRSFIISMAKGVKSFSVARTTISMGLFLQYASNSFKALGVDVENIRYFRAVGLLLPHDKGNKDASANKTG